MKKGFVNCPLLLFSLFFVGCAGIGVDNEPPKVNTKLSYKDLLGTYVFTPDTTQAKKLGVTAGDTVILKITDKQVKGFKRCLWLVLRQILH
jgi:hypothetical protein